MHYHWDQPNSLIKDIEIFAPHKREEALIHAPKDADPEQLWNLSCAIRKAGLAAEADNEGDQPVLRVVGFKSRKELFSVLRKENALSHENPTSISKDSNDIDKNRGMNKLQLAGAMQMLADMLIVGKTFQTRGWEKGKGDILSSSKWIGAFSLLTFFGAKSPDKQTDYIYKDLKDQLAKSGYQINTEDAASLSALAEKSGILPKIERAVREHPVLINAMIQASGGLDNISAGFTQKFYDGTPNYLKSLGGVTTASGQILGGILLEPKSKTPPLNTVDKNGNPVTLENDKTKDNTGTPNAGIAEIITDNNADEPEKNKARKGFFARIKDRIDENPLFITGNLSFVSNVSRIAGSFVEKKKYREYMGVDKNWKGSPKETEAEILKNNFNGGVYAQDRQKFQEYLSEHNIDLNAKEVFKNSITINENESVLNTEKDLLKNPKLKSIKENRLTHGHNENITDHYQEAIKKRDELNDTFATVSKTNAAGSAELIANGIKMASNILIASSDAKIDADLDKTGQLDEICNFMAHVTKAQPPEKRNETLKGLSLMLSSQDGIEINEDEISSRIGKKLDLLEKNPWDKPEQHETSPELKENNPIPQVHEIASHSLQQNSSFATQTASV